MKAILSVLFILAFVPLIQGCTKASAIESRNVATLREMFKKHRESKPDLDFIERTHSKKYIQYVDGKTLNYDDYIQHYLRLKEAVSNIQVTFDHIVAKGNKVATAHRAQAVKHDGKIIKVKVVALFEFDEEGKLILCDELTRLVDGNEEDRDLGSRT